MDMETPKEHRHLTSGEGPERGSEGEREPSVKKQMLRGLSSERITVRKMGQGTVT